MIFDLDGTISDPALGIGGSIDFALAHFGYPPIAQDQVSQFIGPPLDLSFRAITSSTSSNHIADLVAKYRERYGDVGYTENTPYPGISEALASLVYNGIPIGLCTSKRVDFAEKILQMFGLRDHFKFLSGGDIGIHKREQLASLRLEHTVAASSIMIGDRAVDVEAAQSNGLQSVGVLWGHGSLEELTAAKPDRLLTATNELPLLRQYLAGGVGDSRFIFCCAAYGTTGGTLSLG